MGLFEDELRKAQQFRAQQNAIAQAQQAELDYNNRLANANAQAQQAQNAAPGGLAGVLAGIGNSIKNVGDTLYNMGGTGIASIRDIFTGNAGTGKYQKEWDQYAKENIYGNKDMSDKDYHLKTGGKALDAAATVSDFIPGVGGAAKVALNVGQGVASGVAQNYIDNGENATIEDSLKGGLIGGASAGVGQYVGGKLAGKKAGKGIISKALNSQVGKGAITGAASGATGAGLASALNGGNLGEVLGSAAQGAGGGALGGGAMAGVMGLAGTGLEKLNNKVLGVDADTTTPVVKAVEPVQDIDGDGETSILGRALKKTGNQLESAQTDITRAERRKLGIKDAGQTVENVRKRTGISSLQDQADFAQNITGGKDSIMDEVQRYNMSKGADGKPITLTADKYEVAINEAVGHNWKKSVMGESYDDFRNNLISDMVNEDPITASNWLKSEAATQRGIADAKGPTADKAARKARIYTDVANKIDDLTYSAVPQKNVDRMFTDTIDEFRTRANEAKASGNKKYAKAYTQLADQLEKTPRTIADYRSFKADFVKSSQLADISAGAKSGSLQAGIGKGRNVKDKILNTALGEPTDRALAWAGGKLNDLGDYVDGKSNGATGRAIKSVANTAGKVAGALNNDTIANARLGGNVGERYNLPSFGELATAQTARQAGKAEAGQVNARRDLQNAQQEMQNAQNDYNNAMLQAQNAYNNAQIAQVNPGQEQLDRIANALQMALNAGDLDAYSQLLDLYKQANSIYGAGAATTSGASGLNATQQNNLAKLEAAGTAIDQLEALYNQAGGGQGRIGGKLTELGATLGLNSDASAYNSAARGLINQIAAAVGKTDSLNTEGEVQRALDLVPKITDTPQEAQVKLKSLRNMLNANKQTYQNIYGVSL